MSAIVGGGRPPRPTDPTFKDGLWALTQRRWDQEAQLHPQALQRELRGTDTERDAGERPGEVKRRGA